MQQRNFKLIETRGVRLRVLVEGRGPLCVLIHGWPESWYSWRHQIDALIAAGYRVAAPDMRGYGGSDKPHAIEAYDMVEMTDDVLGVIEALARPDEAAILVGHDWGAPIAWVTAIRHAARVRAVIGMSVPHLGRGKLPAIERFHEAYRGRFFYQLYFQTPGVAEAELEADLPATIRKIYSAPAGVMGNDSEPKGADAKFLDGLVDPAVLPEWLTQADVDYYVSQFRGSGFRGPLNRYRNQQRDHALLPELSERKVEQPALFIAGAADPVLHMFPGIDVIERMDRWYADLRGKVIVPGAGHWVQQERPREVNEAMFAFLGEV
ncbi:MAG TPA: alpha/beta hydrolase [Polyangiales bacterium]|nr:alpha/beta hydrolase [Polyangiales bacterium]